MSTNHNIILVPNDNIQFITVLQSVIQKLNKHIYAEIRKVVENNDDLHSAAYLRTIVRENIAMKEKYGIWNPVSVHTSDCYSFSINFGIGDESNRNVFVCETVETCEDIDNKGKKSISFELSLYGKTSEILDVIGSICKEFGDTYKTDNNGKVIKKYAIKETA